MDIDTPGIHKVRFRCTPETPLRPIILTHSNECVINEECCRVEIVLGKHFSRDLLPWVDGEYWVLVQDDNYLTARCEGLVCNPIQH